MTNTNNFEVTPIRLTRNWELIRKRDQSYQEKNGTFPKQIYNKSIRYGMLGPNGDIIKCHACGDEFDNNTEAQQHPCEYEVLFREATNRHKVTKPIPFHQSDNTINITREEFDDLNAVVILLKKELGELVDAYLTSGDKGEDEG